MRKTGFWLAALVSLATLVLTACGLGSSTSSGSGIHSGPIVVGISEPLTGDKSDIGTNSSNGYKVWAKVVNDSGGLAGHQVKLVEYDNNSLADTAVSQYRRLITVDKADVLLGPVSSALVAPTESVAAQYNKVFVEGSGGAPKVFSRGFHNMFFVQPATPEHEADSVVNYIKSLPASERPTKAAYPTQDDPFAEPTIDSARTRLEAMGIQTVYPNQPPYPPTQTDFSAIAAKIKASGADALLMGSIADSDGSAGVKAFAAVGWQPKLAWFASGPDSTGTWDQLLGSKADGTMTSVDWLPGLNVPGNSQFENAYKQMFSGSKLVPAEAAEAYASGQVLAAAIKATSSVDNQTLINWLHSNKVQSIEGYFGWDSLGRPVGGSFNMLQWQNGTPVFVWPPKVAANGVKPTYPKPNW